MTARWSDLDDDLLPDPGRLAGVPLALSALLLLGFAVAFVVEDRGGALALLLLYGLVTVPALVSAGLAFEPAVLMVRGRRPPPRTPVLAGLIALGHVGVALVALRPGLDRVLETRDLVGGAVGGVGALAALVVLALTLPGRRPALRVLLALSGGVLLLALVVARAVEQTS